jgi:hypothetical protein
MDMAALADAAIFANYPAEPGKFACELAVKLYDFIENVGDFGVDSVEFFGQTG